MNLIELQSEFGTEEQCLDFLERMRWPKGVRCVICGGDKISKFSTKPGVRKNGKPIPARHLYQCLEPTCKEQFTATSGTIYADTHLPLQKWLAAIALVCNAKKGISAKQMQRDLGVTYKTAWYLNHRIREAMIGSAPEVFEGTIEADATFIGGRYDKRRKRAKYGKQPVFGIVQRGTETEHSKVFALPVVKEIKPVVTGIINDRVSKTAKIYTDEHAAYRGLRKTHDHAIVIHTSKQYVSGDVHSNNIESFWSLFKRGLIGSFHQVSVKHLSRYLAEFTYRFNNRKAEDLFGLVVINLLIGTALGYKRLIATESPISSAPEPSDAEPF